MCDMSDKNDRPSTSQGGEAATEREKRLAVALRANLRRRKRRTGTSESGPLAPPPGDD
jgi:hypothetical protein